MTLPHIADKVFTGPQLAQLLEDGTGATDHGNHLAALKMIKMQGGVFGAVSHSTQVIEALAAL